MDLIRESALFTTILHCVLAASLPSNDLPQTSGLYSVKSTSFGILEIPSFDKDSPTDATIFYVNPRSATLENKMAFEAKTYHDLERDKTKKKQHLPKLEVPSASLKETGPKYLSSTPKVKLDLIGTSGMLPVKVHTSPSDKTETAKEPKPTHKSTKPKKAGEKLDNEVDWIKFIRDLFSKPTEYTKQEDMQEDYLTTPVSLQKETPQNNYQFSSSDQPSSGWTSGILLNPMNIHQTNPGVDVKKNLVHKSFKYTPPYTVLPELMFRPYNTEVEQPRNNQYTSTYKSDYAVDALQPTNIDYPTNLGYPYVHVRAYQNTPYEPERESKQQDFPKKEDTHHKGVTQSVPYKNYLPVNGAKPSISDHGPATHAVKEVVLPPVPASLTLLQRQQIILLNTVAGLPGGSTAGLDAVRAG